MDENGWAGLPERILYRRGGGIGMRYKLAALPSIICALPVRYFNSRRGHSLKHHAIKVGTSLRQSPLEEIPAHSPERRTPGVLCGAGGLRASDAERPAQAENSSVTLWFRLT